MIVIRQLLDRLSARRLRLRAEQIAALAADQLATVYPAQIAFDGPPQRVLVFTPHADDETFGAGGTLLRHSERGDSISVMLFSDNIASIDGADLAREQKRVLREEEFRAAMQSLPDAALTLLGLDDEALLEHAPIPDIVVKQLIEFQPDILYLPSLFDNHRDHRVLNIWLLRTLPNIADVRPLIRGFEVWSPLPATAVADISGQVAQKKHMIHCYPTQLRAIDYEHHIIGLNAYRAMTFGKTARYAEAFLELPSDAYLTLGNSLFHL